MTASTLSRALGAAVAGCLLVPGASFAADGERTPLELGAEATARSAESAGVSGASLVRTIVGLAVVLGVILALHWILKQARASTQGRRSGSGLSTLAALPLGPNRELHLVRAGSELVLLAAGEHGITPIRSYTEAEARACGLPVDEPGPELGLAVTSASAGAFGTSNGRPDVAGTFRGALARLRARSVIR